MLALDSLVIDLMFQKNAALDPEVLIEAFGGEEEASNHKILDPDMQDPRFEMELSPSMPFRRRGERRLLLVDDSVAPMREDPRLSHLVPLDLRPAKARLISMCETLDVRLGRLFALGSWGDAVLVARSARDLRGICLLGWVMDPTVDVDGKRRAAHLSQSEFEAKFVAFEKRLDELDENQILAGLHGARFERHGELLVVDVLEDDGTWDLRRSMQMESELAAVQHFSLIPGAPSAGKGRDDDRAATEDADRKAGTGGKKEVAPAVPLRLEDIDGRPLLIFPAERFDLDVAAALGKRDYETVIHRNDGVSGQIRDLIRRDGADFVAPLEFLSEVFVDGKPLLKKTFEEQATAVSEQVRSLPVHCPRFGPVLLLEIAEHGRFITSARHAADRVAALLAAS